MLVPNLESGEATAVKRAPYAPIVGQPAVVIVSA